jgi:putative membrane protein insertion efficiency factor
VKTVALLLIKAYRIFLSPLIGTHCRYYPSCSAYTYEAIARYGFVKGTALGVRRLLRCHPFHEGGIDPVP